MLVRDDSDVVVARGSLRSLASEVGLAAVAVEELATALTEVVRNVVVHAGDGELSIDVVIDPARRGIVVTVLDAGPGIVDVARAMEDGYSTGEGLGLGLSSAKRLTDELTVTSSTAGTKVVMAKWVPAERPR